MRPYSVGAILRRDRPSVYLLFVPGVVDFSPAVAVVGTLSTHSTSKILPTERQPPKQLVLGRTSYQQ
jgi:hypothetical protein